MLSRQVDHALAAVLALALCLACGQAASAREAPRLRNPGFETVGLEGWTLAPSSAPGEGFDIASRASQDGRSLSIAWRGTGSAEGRYVVVSQSLDASEVRGKRLVARVRARTQKAGGLIGLVVRVDRDKGQMGFYDNMIDRPITSPEWSTYQTAGPVADDARRIVIGLVVGGDSAAQFDDVSVEFTDLPPTTPAAKAYLDGALDVLETQFYRRSQIDWARIRRDASDLSRGAAQPGDTYLALRRAVEALKEPHTRFIGAEATTAAPAGGSSDREEAPVAALRGDIVIVRMPGLHGGAGRAYAAQVRRLLGGSKTCGRVIDLRANSGGDMWPMLDGLQPLLGAPPYGWFAGEGRPDKAWIPRGRATRRPLSGPVAVLLGPGAASSGEMVAIALRGAPRARSFGTATAGLTTSNAPFALSDGAKLLVTMARVKDRTGALVEGAIVPDQITDAPEDDAMHWLGQQGCRPSAK